MKMMSNYLLCFRILRDFLDRVLRLLPPCCPGGPAALGGPEAEAPAAEALGGPEAPAAEALGGPEAPAAEALGAEAAEAPGVPEGFGGTALGALIADPIIYI